MYEMTQKGREERLAYIDRAKKIEKSLPDSAYVCGVNIGMLECYSWIQVTGCDLRAFAKSHGAKVESKRINEDYYISTRLFGCEIKTVVTPESPCYAQELKLCETR